MVAPYNYMARTHIGQIFFLNGIAPIRMRLTRLARSGMLSENAWISGLTANAFPGGSASLARFLAGRTGFDGFGLKSAGRSNKGTAVSTLDLESSGNVRT
jgi:hypothetical protein